jgi:predicted LPLAT superfamily acyltransferase
MTFKPCAVVPSHNHHAVIGAVVQQLCDVGLPVFVIDDGSDEASRRVLAALDSPDRGVFVSRLETNRGKGAAVIEGFALAAPAGFTHAIQVDADGQHDLTAVPRFLAMGRENPDALIVGKPQFDGSMPVARRLSRWFSHFWTGIETLSPHLIDGMCGFRLYPLAEVMPLLAQEPVGRFMDFDAEMLVRLIWRGVKPIFLPVGVTYPAGNSSNFRPIADNWLITRMHTRLVVTMLGRLPMVWRHRVRLRTQARHWSRVTERGTAWGLSFLAVVYRLLGPRGLRAALVPIAVYFHLTGTEQRNASRLFLLRAHAARGLNSEPGWRDTFRHSLGFAQETAQTVSAWLGGIDPSDLTSPDQDEISRIAASGNGILLIVSHLGNIEISRALLDGDIRSRLTLLVHTRNSQNYARAVGRLRPDAALNTLQVDEIDPATMARLQQRIDGGGWIVIAGDRTPIRGDRRVSYAPFLGHDAPFPQGPYILAHLLECPVYLMFCLREKGHYAVHFEKFADRISLPRRDREGALRHYATRYAQRLESFCLRDPFQWHNFYNFWAMTPQARRQEQR